jgi:dihydrolipoamide dehydrogenase
MIMQRDGMVKLIIGKEFGQILGAHIIGPRATDMIAECALMIKMEATIDEVIATIHAHPTVSESIREAALAADRRAIHILNR